MDLAGKCSPDSDQIGVPVGKKPDAGAEEEAKKHLSYSVHSAWDGFGVPLDWGTVVDGLLMDLVAGPGAVAWAMKPGSWEMR